MTNQTLYNNLLARFDTELQQQPDKPDETAETTLKALWLTAAGMPSSACSAQNYSLPALDEEQKKELESFVEQRLEGIPLAHITERQQFMGIELLAGPEALIPRKETEILAGAAVRLLKDIERRSSRPQIMDVCTGAGNLAIVLAMKCPGALIFAADLSSDAVALARKNVAFHHLEDRVEVRTGDLFEPFDTENFLNSVDLITCNPPYISTARVGEMDEEISQHEPSLAFDGGAFGIKILHRVIKEAPRFLKKGGWLAIEVGLGQGETMLKRMVKKYSYSDVTPCCDQNGAIRAIFARKGDTM